MAGFRTFATGEVLTAANVNNFLMKQSVMVFADDAARTAALGSEVTEGMLTFNKDTGALEVFNGATFVEAGGAGLPPGAVAYFAFDSAPDGFLKANGAEISRTVFSDLFGAISISFGGGDGSTTFNVPDLRGEFVRSFDDGRGVDDGRVFGSEQATETNAILQFRTQAAGFSNISTQTVSDNGTFAAVAGGFFADTGSGARGISMRRSGAETRPRNVALLACIKF